LHTLPDLVRLDHFPALLDERSEFDGRHAGEAAFIQRCQVHKKRNVVDHLPDEHKAEVKRKLQNAYAMTVYADAKRALDRLHRELMDLNPSAARSLEEGMEETLTVHKLRVPEQLRRSLCCTNVIESAFSIVETVCRNVKRWRPGDQIERWVGSGLLVPYSPHEGQPGRYLAVWRLFARRPTYPCKDSAADCASWR
jgi:hypothetical protein